MTTPLFSPKQPISRCHAADLLLGHGRRPIAIPPPKSAKKSQQNGGTNWQTNFSAKQVASALDLSPRPQTHLPFGCSVVGVMWKPKISLNFQKKNSSLGLYMVPEDMYVSVSQWSSGICPGVKINWWRCRSQKPQQVGRTKRSNHRNPTNRFNSRTHCFLHFCQLS